MPTAASNTFGNARLDPVYKSANALVHHVKLQASQTIAKGTVMGELTASPGTFKVYATGNADGSETAKCIMQYDVVTDASQKVTIGGGEAGQKYETAPVYFSGYFRTTELVGLDAAGIVDFGGHMVSGVVADGIVCLPGS